eukprot:TRINITY_DN70429_c0_g1_i1.p1 TRINITY_DN70429_c0_g1~~TRINITY_DN70429_c0_g1_i1.p1  ORF type:complete len:265 (-),score=16.77 TRINITY_DN70429_c0_g1_i1:28-822(-)
MAGTNVDEEAEISLDVLLALSGELYTTIHIKPRVETVANLLHKIESHRNECVKLLVPRSITTGRESELQCEVDSNELEHTEPLLLERRLNLGASAITLHSQHKPDSSDQLLNTTTTEGLKLDSSVESLLSTASHSNAIRILIVPPPRSGLYRNTYSAVTYRELPLEAESEDEAVQFHLQIEGDGSCKCRIYDFEQHSTRWRGKGEWKWDAAERKFRFTWLQSSYEFDEERRRYYDEAFALTGMTERCCGGGSSRILERRKRQRC